MDWNNRKEVADYTDKLEKEIAELKDDNNRLSHELAQAVDIFNDHKEEIAELKKKEARLHKTIKYNSDFIEYQGNKLAEAREVIKFYSLLTHLDLYQSNDQGKMARKYLEENK